MALQKLGKYEIVGEIGRGAMGVVYKAFDPTLERELALKTMMASMGGMDAESKARFYREARSVAKLTHRNIVTIYDMGEEEGIPFIAMEYLDGVDLHKKMKREGPLPIREGLKIASQVLQGLNYAHQFQIVHRDIKPANIYILKNGTAKILDFGIAKLATSEMTRTGMVLGTVDYMSPEQIRADKAVDGRSDLFSAGVILFELMAGRKPFPGETITQIMFKIVHDPPGEVPPERDLPARLLAASRRSLEKDPLKRFQTGDEFASELDAIIQQIDAELTTVRGISPDKLDPKAGVTTARRLFESGYSEESAAVLKEVLRKDPGNKEATALFTVVERRVGGSDKTVILGQEEAPPPSSPRSSSIEQILAEIEEERKTTHDPSRSDVEARDLTLRLDDSGPRSGVHAEPPSTPVPGGRPDRPTEPLGVAKKAGAMEPPRKKAGARGADAKAAGAVETAKPADVRAATAARAAERKGAPAVSPRQPAAGSAVATSSTSEPASKMPLALIVGGVVVVAAIVGGVMMMRKPTEKPAAGPTTPPPSQAAAPISPPVAPVAAAGFLSIDAEPWAEIASIRETGSGKTIPLTAEPGHSGPTTPIAIDLAPGRYEIVLKHPEYPEVTLRDVQIQAGQWTRTHQLMPGFSFKPKMPAGPS